MSLFGTAGIRGPVEEVTPSLALAVGQAAGDPETSFVVGRDGRETSAALASAVEAGLESAGSDVYRVGRVPTPALAFASRGRRGVMITASHNPPQDNGIKLFDDGVEYDREAERAIEDRVTAGESGPSITAWDAWGGSEALEVLDRYRDAVVSYIREAFAGGEAPSETAKPLRGLAVAVDCGNGVGSLATPQVLDRLGASVVGVNANVDGHFVARESKPTPETLSEFATFLAEGGFDLGLAHDGDADRLVVLGPDGEVIHEDTVLAAVAAHYAAASDAADPVVVTTPNASARIDERVREVGGRVERVRLGALHEGIARERRAAGQNTEVVFAAEPWKHVHPAFGGWIDGVVSAAAVAALVVERGDTDAFRAPITERPYRKESVGCPDRAKAGAMAALETALPEAYPTAAVDTDYGVRLEFDDASWILVRPSGTEPYIRMYAESDDVDELVADAREVVERAIDDAR